MCGLKPGATVDVEGLRLHVREHLAAYKVPKYIELWSQELPKNANGKVLKQELRERHAPLCDRLMRAE